MSKNTYVNLHSIEKIYLTMNCRLEDVVEIIEDSTREKNNEQFIAIKKKGNA
jgi:hypothetical protein